MTELPFSVDIALRIHALILTTTGGAPGLRDRGLLESALAAPFATFEGLDLHRSVTEKAAQLARGIIQNHPFVDGNKRTAAVLAITFMRLHGLDLAAPDSDTEEIFVGLADKTVSPEAFTAWFVEHIRPYPGS